MKKIKKLLKDNFSVVILLTPILIYISVFFIKYFYYVNEGIPVEFIEIKPWDIGIFFLGILPFFLFLPFYYFIFSLKLSEIKSKINIVTFVIGFIISSGLIIFYYYFPSILSALNPKILSIIESIYYFLYSLGLTIGYYFLSSLILYFLITRIKDVLKYKKIEATELCLYMLLLFVFFISLSVSYSLGKQSTKNICEINNQEYRLIGKNSNYIFMKPINKNSDENVVFIIQKSDLDIFTCRKK